MNAGLVTALKDRYAIERTIGAGGMATVYLARDLKHNRNVALKVLSPELGAVLGVERFLAEIQVTANLQHPHLLPLFDSGEAAGLLYYVMPYVEGESLRARLDRERQLPIDDAVRIATSVASALDYAHRHNVVHRDLKPENILLHDGQPVVADFGIALAVSNAGGTRVTQTGLSLGTPQYMSPEQATGDRAVDGRSDIYSLGALTYEMLAGEAPHLGNTVQAIVAKVLTEKPANVRTRRATVPVHIAAALERALEKTPADRFTTAQDFAEALAGRFSYPVPAPSDVPTMHARPTTGARVRALAPWGIAVAAVGALVWRLVSATSPPELPVIRAHLDLPADVRVNDALTGPTLAVSPKGDVIVFTNVNTNRFRMYLRRTNELFPRQISTEEYNGRNFSFSPDGRWLAFTEGLLLYKVSVDHGQIVPIGTSAAAVPYGLAWIGADTIVVGSFSGLFTVPAAGGTPRRVARADSTQQPAQRWPMVIAGTDAVLYTAGSSSGTDGRLAVISRRTGKVTPLDIPAIAPLGILHGQLVFTTTDGTVAAVPFDVRTLRATGDPVPLEQEVIVDYTAGAKVSLSESGTLAYLRGRTEARPTLVGGAGAREVPLLAELHQYQTPRYSPDGKRVAVTVASLNALDIWIYDIARRTFTRLTTEGSNLRPEWTPDGKRIVFRSERNGQPAIWWQPADGSGPAELLFKSDVDPYEAIVSPDAKWLVLRSGPGGTYSRDVLAVPLGPTGVPPDVKPTAVVTSGFAETMPRLSPDGRWLAYQSNESGRFEIYVRPFPGAGARVQVSDGGGTEPVWGRDGRALYYRRDEADVVAVSVTTGREFSIGGRRTALTGNYLLESSHASYDLAPDGRLLMLKRAGTETEAIVVHNWGRELREKMRR